jgi:hypothetical protein
MTNPVDLDVVMDGLTGQFWTWFSTHVTNEWGPAGLRYQQAVRAAATDANAVVELQKVLYAQEQILLLMRHPQEKLNVLKQKAIQAAEKERGVVLSRGGL